MSGWRFTWGHWEFGADGDQALWCQHPKFGDGMCGETMFLQVNVWPLKCNKSWNEVKNWIRSSDNDLLILEAPRLQKLGMPGCHNLLKSLWKQIEFFENEHFILILINEFSWFFDALLIVTAFRWTLHLNRRVFRSLRNHPALHFFSDGFFRAKWRSGKSRSPIVQKVHVQNAKCALSCWSLADREKSGGKNSRCLANFCARCLTLGASNWKHFATECPNLEKHPTT